MTVAHIVPTWRSTAASCAGSRIIAASRLRAPPVRYASTANPSPTSGADWPGSSGFFDRHARPFNIAVMASMVGLTAWAALRSKFFVKNIEDEEHAQMEDRSMLQLQRQVEQAPGHLPSGGKLGHNDRAAGN